MNEVLKLPMNLETQMPSGYYLCTLKHYVSGCLGSPKQAPLR